MNDGRHPVPLRARLAAAVALTASVLAVALAVTSFLWAPAAVPFAGRIALMVEMNSPISSYQGQYVYIRSRVAWTVAENNGKPVLDRVHDREIWIPEKVGGRGYLREQGTFEDGIAVNGMTPHQQLTDLPTDPGTLLQQIRHGAQDQPEGPDQAAFDRVGDTLRESLLPPKLAAALFHATATIPGVTRIPDATDAAGRHGTALARTNAGTRTEWIFDPRTLQYLGERSYRLKDGTLTATTAVTTRAVVSKLGQRPA